PARLPRLLGRGPRPRGPRRGPSSRSRTRGPAARPARAGAAAGGVRSFARRAGDRAAGAVAHPGRGRGRGPVRALGFVGGAALAADRTPGQRGARERGGVLVESLRWIARARAARPR